MKTAVSIPDDLFDEAEILAANLGLNRSQLYARALRTLIEGGGADPVTARIDALVERDGQAPEALSGGTATQLIDSGAWGEW